MAKIFHTCIIYKFILEIKLRRDIKYYKFFYSKSLEKGPGDKIGCQKYLFFLQPTAQFCQDHGVSWMGPEHFQKSQLHVTWRAILYTFTFMKKGTIYQFIS